MLAAKMVEKIYNKIAKPLFSPDLCPSKCQRTIRRGYSLMEREKKDSKQINMREIE